MTLVEIKRLMQRDLDKEIFQPLSREDEEKLVSRLGEDEETDELIILELRNRNIRFAISEVLKLCTDGKYLYDLIQVSFLALDVAARKFDKDMGTRYITYANWWIRRMCIDFIRKNSRAVKFSDHVWKDLATMNREILEAEQREEPVCFSMSKERMEQARMLEMYPHSTDAEIKSGRKNYDSHGEPRTVLDRIIPDVPGTDFFFEDIDDDIIFAIKNKLSDVEWDILLSYLGKGEGMVEIGERLGVSKQRVHQIKEVALEKAKKIAWRIHELR